MATKRIWWTGSRRVAISRHTRYAVEKRNSGTPAGRAPNCSRGAARDLGTVLALCSPLTSRTSCHGAPPAYGGRICAACAPRHAIGQALAAGGSCASWLPRIYERPANCHGSKVQGPSLEREQKQPPHVRSSGSSCGISVLEGDRPQYRNGATRRDAFAATLPPSAPMVASLVVASLCSSLAEFSASPFRCLSTESKPASAIVSTSQANMPTWGPDLLANPYLCPSTRPCREPTMQSRHLLAIPNCYVITPRCDDGRVTRPAVRRERASSHRTPAAVTPTWPERNSRLQAGDSVDASEIRESLVPRSPR